MVGMVSGVWGGELELRSEYKDHSRTNSFPSAAARWGWRVIELILKLMLSTFRAKRWHFDPLCTHRVGWG